MFLKPSTDQINQELLCISFESHVVYSVFLIRQSSLRKCSRGLHRAPLPAAISDGIGDFISSSLNVAFEPPSL